MTTEPRTAAGRHLLSRFGVGDPDWSEEIVAIEAQASFDIGRLRNAVRRTTSDWHRRGLLRFNSRDDGSDDLLLADAIVAAYRDGGPR